MSASEIPEHYEPLTFRQFGLLQTIDCFLRENRRYPSQRELALAIDRVQNTVRAALSALCAKGYLKKVGSRINIRLTERAALLLSREDFQSCLVRESPGWRPGEKNYERSIAGRKPPQ